MCFYVDSFQVPLESTFHLCVCVIQRQRLINTRSLTNGDSDVPVKGGSKRGVENGLPGVERGVRIRHDQEEGNETENEDNENNENDDEEEEGEGPFVPYRCPGTRWKHTCIFILSRTAMKL